ncbi:hypothetical protein [Pseudonocardia sp. TRM90224]|uniref:hypothetical protein n=1 Tax=Pseudonocardia sp. TRM90224 TaxID=2812678 RepID=UPI001E5C1D72|nr:hypothetical protein [Pseudonocardia sp. TRM90224]
MQDPTQDGDDAATDDGTAPARPDANPVDPPEGTMKLNRKPAESAPEEATAAGSDEPETGEQEYSGTLILRPATKPDPAEHHGATAKTRPAAATAPLSDAGDAPSTAKTRPAATPPEPDAEDAPATALTRPPAAQSKVDAGLDAPAADAPATDAPATAKTRPAVEPTAAAANSNTGETVVTRPAAKPAEPAPVPPAPVRPDSETVIARPASNPAAAAPVRPDSETVVARPAATPPAAEPIRPDSETVVARPAMSLTKPTDDDATVVARPATNPTASDDDGATIVARPATNLTKPAKDDDATVVSRPATNLSKDHDATVVTRPAASPATPAAPVPHWHRSAQQPPPAQPNPAQSNPAQGVLPHHPTQAYVPPGHPAQQPPPFGPPPGQQTAPGAMFPPQFPQQHAAQGGWRPPPPPPNRRRTPLWVPLTAIGGLLVVVAAVVLVVYLSSVGRPVDLATDAANEVDKWNGATLSGSVTEAGEKITYDLRVTAQGAQGTVSAGSGARAEVLRDATGVLIKGNKAWWDRHYPERSARLADTWVADPLDELDSIDPLLRLTPDQLTIKVRPAPGSQWKQTGEQVIDGRRGLVITDGTRRLIIDAETYELLCIDLLDGPPPPGTDPTRVIQLPPAQVAEVGSAASDVRTRETPKSLNQRLLERARFAIDVKPESLCQSPTCTAVITISNSGELAGTGRVDVTANGVAAGTFPLNVPPGQSVSFTASTPNTIYNQPGASGDLYWEAKITPDE